MSLTWQFENQYKNVVDRSVCVSNVALTAGYGMCYDRTYVTTNTGETITDAWAARDKFVILPTVATSRDFAGVLTTTYAAYSGSQTVELVREGTCDVYVDASVTQGDMVWCLIKTGSTGQFSKTYPGFNGAGMARCLQSRTGAGLVQVYLYGATLQGTTQSGLVQVFTAAEVTAGGAVSVTPTGHTVFTGGVTPASDVTSTLADGKVFGERKGYTVTGTLTTNKVVVTATTGLSVKPAGTSFDGFQALSTITIAAAAKVSLAYDVGGWMVTSNNSNANAVQA